MPDKRNDYNGTSMEEILSSIRKYVADEVDDTVYEDNEEDTFDLNEDHLSNPMSGNNNSKKVHDSGIDSDIEEGSIFTRLANTIKNQYKPQNENKNINKNAFDVPVSQFLHDIAASIIEEWCNNNLRQMIEEIVMQEIERLKSE